MTSHAITDVIQQLAARNGLLHPNGRVNCSAFGRFSDLPSTTVMRLLKAGSFSSPRVNTVLHISHAFGIRESQVLGYEPLGEDGYVATTSRYRGTASDRDVPQKIAAQNEAPQQAASQQEDPDNYDQGSIRLAIPPPSTVRSPHHEDQLDWATESAEGGGHMVLSGVEQAIILNLRRLEATARQEALSFIEFKIRTSG